MTHLAGREGAPPRRPRWGPLAAAGLAAAGAFVAAGVWIRAGSGDLRRDQLVAALGDVAGTRPGEDGRGTPADGAAVALRAAAAQVGAERLEVRQRDRCAPDEIARYGAAAVGGPLRVFLVRYRDGAEAHVWGDAGAEVAAAAVRDGRRVEPAALSRAGAEAALAACTALRR